MTLNEYQERAMTTCTESSYNDAYALFGLVAEVGELADIVAKGVRKQTISIEENVIQPRYGRDPHKKIMLKDFEEGMTNELGDVLWFVALIAQRFGLTLDEVAQTNLDKLADRKKNGTIISHEDH